MPWEGIELWKIQDTIVSIIIRSKRLGTANFSLSYYPPLGRRWGYAQAGLSPQASSTSLPAQGETPALSPSAHLECSPLQSHPCSQNSSNIHKMMQLPAEKIRDLPKDVILVGGRWSSLAWQGWECSGWLFWPSHILFLEGVPTITSAQLWRFGKYSVLKSF